MVAREAVQAAKDYILEVYGDEDIVEVGLEELEFLEEDSGVWQVTIGFRRKWQQPFDPGPPPHEARDFLRSPKPRLARNYKTVRIRDDGTVLSMTHRDVSVPA